MTTNSVDSFLIDNVDPTITDRLMDYIRAERGIHTVEIRDSRDESNQIRRVIYTGTQRAVGRISHMSRFMAVYREPNSDHDHDKCIEFAQSQGVPPSWAHRVETYLSM